jgi:hypothetical protein
MQFARNTANVSILNTTTPAASSTARSALHGKPYCSASLPICRNFLALEHLVYDCFEVAQAFVDVACLNLLLALSTTALDVLRSSQVHQVQLAATTDTWQQMRVDSVTSLEHF